MKDIESIEVAAIKRKIKEAMEREDYEAVDGFSRELCKLQGFDDEPQMPEDFLFQLKTRERKQNRMRVSKQIIKVAIAVLIISVSGGTVYAAVHHYRKVEQMDHGLVICDDSKDVKSSYTSSESDLNIITPSMIMEDTKVDVISKETNEDQNTEVKHVWETKEVRTETNQGLMSDDGVNWEDAEADVCKVTEYTYNDFATACKDQDMVTIFNKAFELKDQVIVTNYDHEEEIVGNMNTLKSSFLYGNGSFQVEIQEDIAYNQLEESNNHHVLITTTDEVSNQRKYISVNGIEFQMSDDVEEGDPRTTTMISKDEYTVIISFMNLTDDEIHEVLDSIQF